MSVISKILRPFKKYPSSFAEMLVRDNTSDITIQPSGNATILIQVIPDDCYFGLMYGLSMDIQQVTGSNVDLLVTRGINASIGRSIPAVLKRLNTVNYLYMKNWVKPFRNANAKVFWASQVSQLTKLQKSQQAYRLWKQWKNNQNNNNHPRHVLNNLKSLQYQKYSYSH